MSGFNFWGILGGAPEAEAKDPTTNWDTYWGPSDGPRTDPKAWDLYWATLPDGALTEDDRSRGFKGLSFSRQRPNSPASPSDGEQRELTKLEFPMEDAPQGLIECIPISILGPSKEDVYRLEAIQNKLRAKRDSWDELDAPDIDAAAGDDTNMLLKEAAILRKSLARFGKHPSGLAAGEEGVATKTVKTLEDIKSALPNLKRLRLPGEYDSGHGSPWQTPKGSPRALHHQFGPLLHSKSPMATYTRVKSRLQDQPLMIAAFADQVSTLSPSSFSPREKLMPGTPEAHELSAKSVLVRNLRELLPSKPTPAATPRKMSMISALSLHTAAPKQADVVEVLCSSSKLCVFMMRLTA